MSSNTEILIKRSLANNTPSLLNQGELAYSYASNTLFIGTPDSDGAIEIGHYSNLTNLTAGTYGDTTIIPIITVDSHGTVTNVTTSTISTTLTINADSGGPNNVSLITDTINYYGGDGITTAINRDTAGVANVTFDLDDTIIRANGAGGSTYQTIDGVLNISGSLNVSGNISYTNVDTIISQNSLIKLANNNITSDVVDIGFYGESNNGTEVVYTGLFRHAGDAGKDYYLFDSYNKADPDVDFVIDPTDPSFTVSTLHANLISGSVQSHKFLADESSDTNGGYGFYQDGAQDTGMYSSGDGLIQFKSNGVNNSEITSGGFRHYTNVTFDVGGSTLGDTNQKSVFFGYNAGETSQGENAVAIGSESGQTSQGGFAVAVGLHAGQTSQGTAGVAIGHVAGQTSQGQDAVAVGVGAGINNQGNNAVAIGERAGAGYTTAQGEYAVAIGAHAGYQSQAAYSIAINASGSDLSPTESGLYIDPIRNDSAGGNVTSYNTSTKELVQTNVTIANNGITLANGTNITDGESGLFVDSLNYGETTNIVFYNTSTKELTYGSQADLRGDAISNGSYIWTVSADNGSLFSDLGTTIADSATNVIIGQNVDLTNTNTNRVAIGNSAGSTEQSYGSVAVGDGAGNLNQNAWSVAVGLNAGNNNQSNSSTAVGHGAGYNYQGSDSVAVGVVAGKESQGYSSVAVGNRAGYDHQNNYAVAVGNYAGYTYQSHGAVAIGDYAGYNYQSTDGIAIGTYAGENSSAGNGWAPIAIGRYAGQDNAGSQSVAIGNNAGNYGLGYHAVAIGHYAASNGSGNYAVAIGDASGQAAGFGTIAMGYESGSSANDYSIAIGYQAGYYGSTPLGQYQIAIGAYAAQTYGQDNSIVLNASGYNLSPSSSGFFVDPVAYTATQDSVDDGIMFYNQSTKEIRYSYTLDGGSF